MPSQRRRWLRRGGLTWTWILPALIVLMIVVPIITVVQNAASESFASLWDRATAIPRIGQTLINTVILGISSTILATLIGVTFAWLAVHLRGTRQRFATLIGVAPLLVPGIAGATGWVFMFAPRVGYGNVVLRNLLGLEAQTGPVQIFSALGIVIVVAIYLVPYPMLFTLAALRKTDTTLVKAAQTSGSSWIGAQFRVVLPLLRPAITYGAGIVLLLGLGQFVVVLILGRQNGIDVLTTEIYRHLEFYGASIDYALACFLGLPLIVTALALVVAQRWFVGDPMKYVSVAKGTGSPPREVRWGVYPLVIFSFLTVVPPLIGLAIVSLSPFWSGNIGWANLSLDAYRSLRDNEFFWVAIVNSMKFALITAVLSVVIAFAVALIVERRQRGVVRTVVEFVIQLPLSIPAILFGLGVLLSLGFTKFEVFGVEVNLYGSSVLLVLAYIVLTLPQGLRNMQAGLAQVNRALESAAEVSGASRFRTYVDVTVPLIRHSLISAALLTFILASREFAASVLLTTPKTQTMAPLLYNLYNNGTYPPVAALALVMVFLSAVGVLLILVLGGRDALERF